MNNPPIIFIVGPTAVGKTDVALAFAQKLKGEIVSCDSMQVYKEVSIASNKPSALQLKKVKHHLLGIVSVKKEFDVAAFQKRAVAAIKGIIRRGKMPIVTGGSGMYMQVLLDGIFDKAEKNDQLRAKFEKELARGGADVLYARLKQVDPQAAAKIHFNDHRRVIRALEIFELKKQPMSDLKKMRKGLWETYDIKIFALNRERSELYERINERVDEMFAAGLIDEMKKISKMKLSQTAQGMIGLKEVRGFLRREYDLERAKYLLKRNTRHFAKRQLTWFRKDKRLQWIHVEEDDRLENIIKAISCQLSAKEI